MKRLLIQPLLLLLILLAFSAPAALAQSVNPATYLPGSTSAYIEIHTDEASLASLNQLSGVVASLSGMPGDMQIDLLDLLALPGIDARADVLPWLGDRIGIGMLTLFRDDDNIGDIIVVLPVADAAAARAFVTKATDGASSEPLGGVTVYKTAAYGMAVGADVIWLSNPTGIDALLSAPMLQRLTDNPGYRQVRAALPETALVNVYLGGDALIGMLNQYTFASISPDQPTPAAIIEAALRLHPAQSAAEDALLANSGLSGIGVALQASDAQIDVIAVASVDATYPAPTLTTTTAGSTLLQLVPSDSFLVFSSYDVYALALPLAGLAVLGPTVGSTFTSISMSLDGTPPPTPTPTPTPTPPPPLTADVLLAQVQPTIAQIESLMGMSLDELYSLSNGEYALAVFPGANQEVSAALYLQSDDPQRLIDTLDHVSKLILIDPAAGTPLVGVEHQIIDGVDVALLGVPGAGDRPAVGIIGGDVLFVTTESAVSKVISASTQPSTTPALSWRDRFGEAQEALLYADLPAIDLYVTRQQRVPPLPFSALAGSFDMRDDGLFVLNLTLTLED